MCSLSSLLNYAKNCIYTEQIKEDIDNTSQIRPTDKINRDDNRSTSFDNYMITIVTLNYNNISKSMKNV